MPQPNHEPPVITTPLRSKATAFTAITGIIYHRPGANAIHPSPSCIHLQAPYLIINCLRATEPPRFPLSFNSPCPGIGSNTGQLVRASFSEAIFTGDLDLSIYREYYLAIAPRRAPPPAAALGSTKRFGPVANCLPAPVFKRKATRGKSTTTTF